MFINDWSSVSLKIPVNQPNRWWNSLLLLMWMGAQIKNAKSCALGAVVWVNWLTYCDTKVHWAASKFFPVDIVVYSVPFKAFGRWNSAHGKISKSHIWQNVNEPFQLSSQLLVILSTLTRRIVTFFTTTFISVHCNTKPILKWAISSSQ